MALHFSRFRFDRNARLLQRDGVALDVPRRVFDCIGYLIEHRARAVGRDELITHVWNRDNVSDNQLAQTVLAARRLLDDDGGTQRLIRTVPGFGYHFIGETRDDADAASAPGPDPPAEPAIEAPLAADATAPQAASLAEELERSPPATVTRSAGALAWRLPALVLLLALALAYGWRLATNAPSTTGWTWVLPAQVEDADAGWARIGIAALVGERLRQHGAVVVPIENVLTRVAQSDQAPDPIALYRELQAAEVIQPLVRRDGANWRVELVSQSASGTRRVEALDAELLRAGETASDRLTGRDRSPEQQVQDRHEMIRQLIRSRDFEAAILQLASLPDSVREGPEAELLRVRLDLERERRDDAGVRAARLRERLDPATHPLVAGQLALLELALETRRGSPGFVRRLAESAGQAGSEGQSYAQREQAALRLLERHGRRRDYAEGLLQRARWLKATGKFGDAQRDCVQARQWFLDDGDELGAATAMAALADLSELAGRPLDTLQQLQDSAGVFERYRAVGRQIATLRRILVVQSGLLQWQAAEATLERIRSQVAATGSADERLDYLAIRALLLASAGRLQEADALLDEAARLQGASDKLLSNLPQYRLQLDLARGDYRAMLAIAPRVHADLAAAAHESVGSRDYRDLALFLWLEARRQSLRLDPAIAIAPLQPLPEGLAEPATGYAWLAHGHWLLEGGDAAAAEAAYRRGLQSFLEVGRLSRILTGTRVLIELLLEQGRNSEASAVFADLLARDPLLAERDFDTAVLALRVRRATGDEESWRSAARSAEALAGERRIPVELLPPPSE